MRALAACLPLAMTGCIGDIASHDIVATASSPSGLLDAIVIESNGGATTSYWYDVCIAPRGDTCTTDDSVAKLYAAARSERAYGVNVRWQDSSHLIVEYLSAQQSKLIDPQIELLDTTIGVALRSGIVDHDAPAGGMLYNLQRSTADAP